MNTNALYAILADWMEHANVLRQYGALGQAQTLDRCVSRIESAIAASDAEVLSLAEAAAECEYSESQLRRLVRDRTIANVGGARSPRVRRGDLPAKAGRLTAKQRTADGVARIRHLEVTR